MRAAVCVLLVGWLVSGIIAQQAGDGTVMSAVPRWAMSAWGDQKIVTDVAVTDDRGGQHLVTVDGGSIGGVALHVSDAPSLHAGQRVRIKGSRLEPVVQDAVIFGKWPTSGPIPYYVNTNSIRVSPDAALAAIAFAANVWPSQSTAAISASYAGPTSGTTAVNNHKSEVFFRDDPSGGYVGQTLVWTENGVFVDADMVFNDAYLLLAGDVPCSGGLWIEDIGAHEFGHFFGLSHSDVPEATMYPSTSYCSQNWRTLAQDDIDGIQANYPAVVSAPPPPPPPPPQPDPTQPCVTGGVSYPAGSTLSKTLPNGQVDAWLTARQAEGWTLLSKSKTKSQTTVSVRCR